LYKKVIESSQSQNVPNRTIERTIQVDKEDESTRQITEKASATYMGVVDIRVDEKGNEVGCCHADTRFELKLEQWHNRNGLDVWREMSTKVAGKHL
jgi:hypothetical protein